MRTKSGIFLAGVFGAVMILCIVAGPATTSEKEGGSSGADVMSLEGGALGEVEFPHSLHQRKSGECSTCHDLFPGERGAIRARQEAGELKKQQVMNTLCIKCHISRQSVSKSAGPTKCAGCHQR